MTAPADTIYEQAIKDPEGTIGSPLDLIEDVRFTLGEKRKILEHWTAMAQQHAESENRDERNADDGASGLLEMIRQADLKIKH